MRRLLALVGVSLLAAVAPVAAVTASAQTAETVTLVASASTIEVGETVALSGAISPPAGGEPVEIRDEADAVVGTVTTTVDGRFELAVEPDSTSTYRAAWRSAVSDEVTVRVRAEVSVRMTAARLFDEVTVRGAVSPARRGTPVDVALLRNGRVVEERTVETGSAGGFRATFRVMEPGTYRARASLAGSDVPGGTRVSDADATPLPALRPGARGVFVELLERRLVELRYRLTGAGDGVYDVRTGDAVVAFHKVHGMPRVSSVGAATWRALADPRTPRPRHDWKGLHLEVDQTRQVLFVVRDGEVTGILHVSTGKASTPTRDGVFRVSRKIAGFSPNRLYYPSFFDGNRALHGWTEVPTYPASHGCVRIPYWNALWVFGLADYGVRVAVYH
jgi:hypothetical protein